MNCHTKSCLVHAATSSIQFKLQGIKISKVTSFDHPKSSITLMAQSIWRSLCIKFDSQTLQSTTETSEHVTWSLHVKEIASQKQFGME